MSLVANVMANKIEASLFVKYSGEDSKVNKEYGKRFRDFLIGLKADGNTQLRLDLLSGKVTPSEFVMYDKD